MRPILPKHRKSQLTVFILLGLVLVLVVGFAFLAAKKPSPDTVPTTGTGSLKPFVETCLKIVTLDAMHEHGLDVGISTPLIEGYVTSYLPSCLNHFSTYREEGYEITEGEMTVYAVINSEALTVDLHFPITLRDGNSVIQFERASYQFPRKIMTTINLGAETVITSADRKIVLVIPAGTEATLDGEPLERVGIEVLDREFDGNSNSVLAGMLAFAGIPHGTEFSKPVTLIHFYDERDVPSTIPEKNVRLGFWSTELGTWVGLPTNVDDVQHILTATTTHFSPYGAVLRCTGEEDTTVFNMPVLVKHDCEECDAEGWTSGDAPSGIPGKLWIQSEDITRYHSVGTVPACSDWTADPRKVATCSDCNGDCSGEDDDGNCPEEECDCEETYFYYSVAEFDGSAEVTIEFADDGDSCIWSGTDEEDKEPSMGKMDSEGPLNQNADIFITAHCLPGGDDSCLITSPGFEESTLTFTLEVTNGGDSPDACLEGGASVRFSGFGVKIENLSVGDKTYFPCTEEQEGDEMVRPFIGGGVDEATPSVCTCEVSEDEDGEETKDCQWTIKEAEEPVPGDGSTTSVPVSVTTSDGTGAGSRRARDKCTDGDKEKKDYPTCPDDFEETYLDKRFTFKGTDDTRNQKFCDIYGDYPEMQYINKNNYDKLLCNENTELHVLGSALRNGRCWLLTEVQQCLEGTSELPDIYIEFDEENADDWVQVEYPYPQCPEDFLENYNNRKFTFTGEEEDTRTKKFCDSLGDYPKMQYRDDLEFANENELLVTDSLLRGGRCWFFIQAQDAIKAPEEKPEFYMEFGNADEWVPGEGYAGCPPADLGYSNAYDECDFPGEYRCEEGGEGAMLSQICCGAGETGNLFSKTCIDDCDEEETKKCFEDLSS